MNSFGSKISESFITDESFMTEQQKVYKIDLKNVK